MIDYRYQVALRFRKSDEPRITREEFAAVTAARAERPIAFREYTDKADAQRQYDELPADIRALCAVQTYAGGAHDAP